MISRRQTFVGLAACCAGGIGIRFASGSVAAHPLIGPCTTPQLAPGDADTQLVPYVATSTDTQQVEPLVAWSTDAPTVTKYQLSNQARKWTAANVGGLTGGKIRLKVGFLDGNSKQQDLVRSLANLWTTKDGAKAIEFAFVKPENAVIRVRFKPRPGRDPSGAWSKIGNEALLVTDTGDPTVMLEYVTDDQTPEMNTFYILHEFGHTLGLLHEHQHPQSGIVWDKPAVYKYFEKEGWSSSQVDDQIFKIYEGKEYYCPGAQGFDLHSVMQYTILDGWTKNNIKVGFNAALTTNDLQCVKALYR